ncbi:MAG: hypothetical protein C4309_04015 [Chloroflexota bacterium]
MGTGAVAVGVSGLAQAARRSGKPSADNTQMRELDSFIGRLLVRNLFQKRRNPHPHPSPAQSRASARLGGSDACSLPWTGEGKGGGEALRSAQGDIFEIPLAMSALKTATEYIIA